MLGCAGAGGAVAPPLVGCMALPAPVCCCPGAAWVSLFACTVSGDSLQPAAGRSCMPDMWMVKVRLHVLGRGGWHSGGRVGAGCKSGCMTETQQGVAGEVVRVLLAPACCGCSSVRVWRLHS